jgi:hypothetical protein
LVTDTGENWCAPELYRLQGEVSMAPGSKQAADSFRLALDIARDQQAKSWELKVLTSMNRHELLS